MLPAYAGQGRQRQVVKTEVMKKLLRGWHAYYKLEKQNKLAIDECAQKLEVLTHGVMGGRCCCLSMPGEGEQGVQWR